jgi:hypothetical protein
MNQEKIVESWIDKEDLPSCAKLKPLRKYHDLYPDDTEEAEAYWDFIGWYLSQDFLLLVSIPKPRNESTFSTFEADDSISFPFSSADYQRTYQFNRYAYKLKKIYEEVEDLALLHSSISQEAGKEKMQKRFRTLVDEEFRSKVIRCIENSKKYPHLVDKAKLRASVAESNRQILKCQDIWKQYAYWE